MFVGAAYAPPPPLSLFGYGKKNISKDMAEKTWVGGVVGLYGSASVIDCLNKQNYIDAVSARPGLPFAGLEAVGRRCIDIHKSDVNDTVTSSVCVVEHAANEAQAMT